MQSDLTFARRKGRGDTVYQHILGMDMAKPEDSIYLYVVGPQAVRPPSEEMSLREMREWLRQLVATGYTFSAIDGFSKPLDITLDE